jgi:N-acetylglucosamine-6-sulfatase
MRTVLAVVVAATLVGPAIAVPARPAAAAQTRPNILIVNTDDQRFDTMSYLPKTRQWMAAGATYPQAQTAIPSCCPSRSDMFTGRYPHNNRVRLQSQANLLDQTTTMQYYLRQAGYRTAMAGKFLTSWPLGTAPPSFDRFATIAGGYNTYTANINGASRRISRTDAAPRNYSTTWLADQLRGYLRGFEATDDTPWFAYYAPQAPHVVEPSDLAVPEPKYASTPVGPCLQPNEADRADKPAYVRWLSYDAAYYRALCESQLRTLLTVDDVMDEIFRQLSADGELADTLIVFTSDNGYLWGEHGRDKKFVPYLPSVRVPLLARWDGHIAAGTDNRLTVNVDVAPTVLEAAGVPVPAGKPQLDGESLLRPSTRTAIFTEYFQDTANGAMWTWAALYDRQVHYVENTRPDGGIVREYYNLATDPAENVNLLGDADRTNDPPAAAVSALSSRLAQLRTASGAPLRS